MNEGIRMSAKEPFGSHQQPHHHDGSNNDGSKTSSSISSAQDLWQEVWAADLELVWHVHCKIFNQPSLRLVMSKLVSAHPLQDISLTIWGIFIVYLFDLGKKQSTG